MQEPLCFNPYRVFKFVATQKLRSAKAILLCFNPYRVFKFVATVRLSKESIIIDTVSIPIGFSSSLQQQAEMSMDLLLELFQSLSGFQVRCNIVRLGI